MTRNRISENLGAVVIIGVWVLLIPLIVLKILQIAVGLVLGFLFTIPSLLVVMGAGAGAKAIESMLPEPKRSAWAAFVADPDSWGFSRFGGWWYGIAVLVYLMLVFIAYQVLSAVIP